MNAPDPGRAVELGCVLARLCDKPPGYIAAAVQLMQKAALLHKRNAEIRCSEPLTDAQEARMARREACAVEKASAALVRIVSREAVQISFGGDLRGTCGGLHVAGQRGDGWCGDGWPIY